MKILLTGGAGFVGHHLEKALIERGHEVFIADRFDLNVRDSHHWNIDLEEQASIAAVLKKVCPDCIFHLAAQSSVSRSWQMPDMTFKTNLLGSVYLFQAIVNHARNSRLIFIGSGEEFGVNCSEQHPFTEEFPCNPHNPYAVSKLAAGQMLALLSARNQIQYVHLRPFNHYGPFQKEGFVIADFCAQIARVEQGCGSRILRVGNLAAKRDFLYIDDVISAYCKLAETCVYPNRIYNLSTGKTHSIHEILTLLQTMSTVSITTEIDPQKFRPVEVPVLVASGERMFQDFGWRPKFSLKSGLEQTLNWWREKIKSEQGNNDKCCSARKQKGI